MRDATTSSASSESTRRASGITQASVQSPQPTVASPVKPHNPQYGEPPSTPPEQVEEIETGSSPANQREMHQKKRRRRSSGIPPMNFNNPDEAFSSSPYSEGSPLGSDPIDVTTEPLSDSSEEENTAMSLDMDLTGQDVTGQSIDLSSPGTDGDSTSSGAKLDEALRQAAAQAGTRGIDFDENGDISMEMATQEITAAFQPWAQRANKRDSVAANRMIAMQDQENENPFSPAFKANFVSQLSKPDQPDETQEMSMDITRAIGGILQQPPAGSSIVENDENGTPTNQRGLKRRRSNANLNAATTAGSPAKRHTSRRSSVRLRRRPSMAAEDPAADDETMDFTMVVGGIKPAAAASQPHDGNRRQSIDTSLGDDTMDFTMVVGGIKSSTEEVDEIAEADDNEDMSMELTVPLDKTILVNPGATGAKLASRSPKQKSPKTPVKATPAKPTPVKTPTPAKGAAKTPTPAKKQKSTTPQKQPRKSPRKTLAPPVFAMETLSSDAQEEVPSGKIIGSDKLIHLDSPAEMRALPSSDTHQAASVASPSTYPVIPPSEIPSTGHVMPTISEEPEITKTLKLSDSIRLLSTPRKATNSSPFKRILDLPKISSTPETSPKKAASPKKAFTPNKAASPLTKSKTPTPKKLKRVRVDSTVPQEEPEQPQSEQAEAQPEEEEDDIERFALEDVLKMMGIKFMDLTTTKRRHTGFPGADMARLADEDEDEEAEQPNLENNVAVALAVVPSLTMFTHVSRPSHTVSH
jgi:kinetochore protein Spc7/SPC105